MKPGHRIDAHQHFWRYDAADYPWIDGSMEALRRDFLPADLAKIIGKAGIDGVVSVQARESLAETEWLLELARTHEFIRGVVGWLPLGDARLPEILDRLGDRRELVGARCVVQGRPAGFLDAAAFNTGVTGLTASGLVYDLLIFANQLKEATRFVDRHPNQVFVLNHAGKPEIRGKSIKAWGNRLRELARRDNVSCKVSGMVTEADWRQWSPGKLHPYYEVVLDAFGVERILFGSDWPVCLLATRYRTWTEMVETWTSTLSKREQSLVMGGNALRIYKL